MLSVILPGIRHMRTPLVVGALWLLVAWLAVGRNLPDKNTATGLWADFYELANLLGQPVVLAALALTAYVVGARMEWLLSLLQERLRRSATGNSPRWWRSVVLPPGLSSDVENVANEMAKRYPDPDQDDGGKQMRLQEFRSALDFAVAAAKFGWPAEAPDLYQEYDRRESERDFTQGIAPPLGALSLTLYFIEPGWNWLAITLLVLALLSKRAGNHQHRELERFVLEAVMTGRVMAPPLTDLMRDWWDRSGVPLPFRRPVRENHDEGLDTNPT